MVDFILLKAEIDDDPLERGYTSMSDEAAAVSLSIKDRPNDRDAVPAQEFIAAIAPAAFPADTKMQAYLALLLGTGSVPLEESNVRNALKAIFAGHASTLTALAALQNEDISRAQELNFGRVRAGTVGQARAM